MGGGGALKNHLARTMMANKREHIEQGLITMQYIALIACANVLDQYVEGERLSDCIKELEKEMQRIWRDECKGDPEIESDLVIGHVEELRRKFGMEELFDE